MPLTPDTSARLTRLAGLAALVVGGLLVLLPAAGATPGGKQAQKIHYPVQTLLTNSLVGHWAVVVRQVGARKTPNMNSYIITTLDTVTGDGTQNVVLILDELDLSKSKIWYRVRLPILPNNSTGWVPRSALGTVTPVYTHLYVNRATQTAVLKKNGRVIFTTRVGVGKPYWPTPPGQFYIRDKLTNFNNPFYGPLAFGTSARSAVLTDWPGGGFVGVHGTNEPDLIPGRISHGCIRLRNDAIVKLSHLLTVGTPLTIT
jgi:lipoprotein-anchoring transpeptidase ErfK/SrfK